MAAQEEFKIRVLPRSEPRRGDGARTGTGKRKIKRTFPRLPAVSPKRLVFVGVILALAAVGAVVMQSAPKSHEMASQKIVRDPTAVKINKLVEDVKVKEDFLRRQRLLDNLRSKDTVGDLEVPVTSFESTRSYGVSLDSENTADRLYEELNERPVQTAENTPDARINAMLEKNKWLNQQERQERVQYVRNFIKSAYDRGYEVDLDQNLQVVGVRPIANRRISLDQAIEKASRQGF